MNQTFNPAQVAAAVYQHCTTYDQYLPPVSADLATSWSKVFAYYNLHTDDLLAAVDAVYAAKGSGYRPLPADIAEAARTIRRDRVQRETDAQRAAREARIDTKSAEHIAEIARELGESKSLPEERAVWPKGPNPLGVKCPWCGAGVGERCVTPGTRSVLTLSRAHPARVDAARESA